MPIIEVKQLTRKFGNITAVDGITFSVEAGEIFAFLGPNGAGKTTTIKMLTTLLHPTAGEISLNGYNPITEQDQARKSFGIVFQDSSLDDELTAEENLQFHAVLYGVEKNLANTRIKELMGIVELEDRKKSLVKTFSGGMKRRLEIARGLLHHPKVFFLDEPTLGLDPQTRNHIWNYIRQLNQKEGITIFFTTHYLEEAAKVAGRIAVIDHGKIVASGSPDELTARTHTKTLEEAFLKLTGNKIREEEGNYMETLRAHRRLHTR